MVVSKKMRYLLVSMLAMLAVPVQAFETEDPLVIHCAAGIRKPVQAAAKAWETETGQPVHLQYGGSGALLSSLQLAPTGDLYVAAEQSYFDLARSRGLVKEIFPLAAQRLVIAVAEGNPKSIHSLEDLKREGITIAIANPQAAAAGRTAQRVLEAAGYWDELQEHVKVTKPTVTDIAVDVRLGAVDAALTWDSTVSQFKGLEAVHDPVLDASREVVSIGVLSSSEQPTSAIQFGRFLSAPDRGGPVFEKHGFEMIEGDPWIEKPRIVLFAGAMLNPAIEELLKSFSEREGIEVERVYNGCGILVSQMKAGAEPDAYLACDRSFLDMVSDRFEPGIDISRNQVVILVKKGNPHGIATLKDLVDSPMKVGISHPEQSALGSLTRAMLKQEGLLESLEASGNIMVVSPTGDYLVNQLRVGGLDAVLVYASNARSAKSTIESTELIPIEVPSAVALQPWAIGRTTRHSRTLGRLLERLCSTESREHFKALGFDWVEGPGT